MIASEVIMQKAISISGVQCFRNSTIKRLSFKSWNSNLVSYWSLFLVRTWDFHLKAYEMSRCPSFDTFLDPTNKKYTFIEILIIRLCIWVEHLNIFPICNSLSAKRFKSFCPGHNTSSIFKRQSHSEYYPNSQLILHAHQIQKNVSSYFKNQKPI